ncbi:bifunctional diaminohydroxyphosphoribosylaminopyrimidine deaminase/5-amino-6-(5-phosphoribosylamino)uracil reductase RibD [Brachybacterium rhamnosum]|uniref:Riboflavin biosynthesis protein RibD n=1 Tax=Brachybacterium rhamnosum TaxID=173361 RepID=A0ABW4PXR7_9MICO
MHDPHPPQPAAAGTAPLPATVLPAAEHAALRRALELAARGPADTPNPQVGCVLLAPDGTTLGEGHHRGAGTPHAEADALADAAARGHDPRGGTAVVTLEPCRHTGRTGPCARALREAGVARVVFALPDPGAAEGGGGAELAAAGIDVAGGPAAVGEELAESALDLIGPWYARAARPAVHVILKTATTLDGRVAAADGTSRWITGPAAREHAHRVRAGVDAIVVGTGTVRADDPALTARPAGAVAGPQPLRVAVGRRPVPATARIRGSDGRFLQATTHDPALVIAHLAARGVRRAVLEGGPRLGTAFLRAGAVDELHAYLAPVHLGAGAAAVGDLGVTTIDGALRWRTVHVDPLGEDVLLVARPA